MTQVTMEKRRYVVLRYTCDATIGRKEFGQALRGHLRKSGFEDEGIPQLTRFDAPHAMVRCRHDQLPQLREALPRMNKVYVGDTKHPLEVETLRTSGTIKTLVEEMGILGDR